MTRVFVLKLVIEESDVNPYVVGIEIGAGDSCLISKTRFSVCVLRWSPNFFKGTHFIQCFHRHRWIFKQKPRKTTARIERFIHTVDECWTWKSRAWMKTSSRREKGCRQEAYYTKRKTIELRVSEWRTKIYFTSIHLIDITLKNLDCSTFHSTINLQRKNQIDNDRLCFKLRTRLFL